MQLALSSLSCVWKKHSVHTVLRAVHIRGSYLLFWVTVAVTLKGKTRE